MAPQDGDEDFVSLLAEYDRKQTRPGRGPQVGDTVKGRVISIGAESVFVELGGKAEGLLALEELTDRSGKVTVAVGDTIEARVVDLGGGSGSILLRKVMGMARGAEAQVELVQAHEHRIPVEGLVTGVVKGGVEVQVSGVRGFCPAGQLDLRFVEDPAVFVGQRLTFRITRLETGRGGQLNLVLSRRALLAEEADARAAELRQRLEVGAVLPGTVTTIKDYGAFVDLGGIEGMLHVSELGFQRVGHPSEVVSVGQPVQVQVTKIEKTGDPRRPEKISLSLKALEKDPWSEVADRYREGARLRGRVVRLQPFGAFVELEPGIEGLVHISQLAADRRVNNPREVVAVGQDVEVIVVGVDAPRRRISLSMTAQSAADAAAEAADFAAVKAGADRGFGTLGDLLKSRLPRK
ncbi:MAG TPA: 30S ribosomal protein S1 [Candidatus Acidoferrum sp.]|nr:30S ribosomal protein S1 [Candidatus Acidoferrum sp.]